MRIKNLLFAFTALVAISLQSCAIADLRTEELKNQNYQKSDEDKGRAILKAAWKAQGMDQLQQFETYEVIAQDHWKGMLGAMGNVWPVNQTSMRMRFAVGTFDSQVEVLEGKKEGFLAGQQSWNYYEKEDGKIEFKEKLDKRISFGLSAYQYFFELTDRLMRAPIVVYAGETEFEGKKYDMVLASWETIEPHKGHDQYRLWINKETKMLDVVENTVRANYLPGAQHLYGSTQMKDYRKINGIYIPFELTVDLNEPSKKETKYVHRLTVKEFQFDTFDKSVLYPNPDLKMLGDVKLDSE
jgi:hypothetical protein